MSRGAGTREKWADERVPQIAKVTGQEELKCEPLNLICWLAVSSLIAVISSLLRRNPTLGGEQGEESSDGRTNRCHWQLFGFSLKVWRGKDHLAASSSGVHLGWISEAVRCTQKRGFLEVWCLWPARTKHTNLPVFPAVFPSGGQD